MVALFALPRSPRILLWAVVVSIVRGNCGHGLARPTRWPRQDDGWGIIHREVMAMLEQEGTDANIGLLEDKTIEDSNFQSWHWEAGAAAAPSFAHFTSGLVRGPHALPSVPSSV